MAIKIIRKSKREFKIECPLCEALISYDFHDISGNAIRCPSCGEFCFHRDRIKEESEDTE